MGQIINLSDIDTASLLKIAHVVKTTVVSPLGSTEPWTPLPLAPMSSSPKKCNRSAARFDDFHVFLAPTVSYGVTDFAAGFKGAMVSLNPLWALIDELVTGFLGDGFDPVSLINHHLDPGHVQTIDVPAKTFGINLGLSVASVSIKSTLGSTSRR